MLEAHMAIVEKTLLQLSEIPSTSGHNLHKGNPREAFIREFLESHLSERVAIGTGEIISSDSVPGESRSQLDLVIYRKDYPKLDFRGGISAFLAESVVATIEVKSVLDYQAIHQAVKAAVRLKKMKRSFSHSLNIGYTPPSILSYVVAYKGPNSLRTVHSWLEKAHLEEGIVVENLPQNCEERIRVPSPSIDGIFLLGKGFVDFDNGPMTFINDEIRSQLPGGKWVIYETEGGSLLFLFSILTHAISSVFSSSFDASPYLTKAKVNFIFKE